MAKLKIAGAWSGDLEVELELYTIPQLREEIAKRSNCDSKSIKLICAGKILKDGEGNQKLSELGIKKNAKILACRVSVDQGNSLKEGLMAEEERSNRLARVKAAATALAKRHADGSLPIEDFNIELEDQSGQKVHLGSETDQRAVMMGLMLHANAKQLIKRQKYEDALEVLEMGEEAFSLCDPKVIELIDNVPILQIDTVWCYFMLRNIRWLSMAGIRLAKAREGIERAHGKDSTRVRLLQAGFSPELALHLRLELLEGVVAYHNDQFEKSLKALTSAQDKYSQLQVSDEALSLLMSMGYKERETKRALRMTNQDVERAVQFLVEEKEKKAQIQQEDSRRRKEIMELKRYGMTPLKKAVDIQRLTELVSIGFEKELAAEALRRNENDREKALDDLINPERNSTIQIDIEAKKRKRERHTKDAAIEELISMGFERSRGTQFMLWHILSTVVAAVRALGTMEKALSLLIAEPTENHAIEANEASLTPTHDTVNSVSLNNEDTMGEASSINETEERDVEMEDELARELQRGDALSDYDIEVTKEGEALNEYLALLVPIGSSQKASSSQ
ncbi:hypothetical protein HHK36_021352 [Tetracentron sinense]|uniref:NEDD8 ultimate buster 1 n=1 Tax=Tetracentron sinense TaxID=13715 RepID=A0A834YWT3_TETSI|nr:hypothetical protein HHK36_021352 [Tetracentron sinense]